MGLKVVRFEPMREALDLRQRLSLRPQQIILSALRFLFFLAN